MFKPPSPNSHHSNNHPKLIETISEKSSYLFFFPKLCLSNVSVTTYLALGILTILIDSAQNGWQQMFFFIIFENKKEIISISKIFESKEKICLLEMVKS